MSEVGGIEFPPDFQVKFVTPEERLKNLVLAVPDYIPAENGTAEVRQAEDFQLCSYRSGEASNSAKVADVRSKTKRNN